MADEAPDNSAYDSDGFRNSGDDSSPDPRSSPFPDKTVEPVPAEVQPEAPGAVVDAALTEAGLSTNPTTRLTEIQDLMAEGDHGPYWKGPHAEALQREYRDLLDRKSGDGNLDETAEPVQLAEGDVSVALDNLSGMGEVGAQFADEIRGDGAKLTLEAMEDTRAGILAEIGASANEVAMAFDGLDDNVRAAVFAEFGNPYVPRLPEAEAEDVAQFTQEASAGKILGAEWGDETPRKLAKVLHRWDRLTERLSDTEMVELDDFWRNRLRANERAAILRKLAA